MTRDSIKIGSIKGIPVFECCNNTNDTLRNRYQLLEAEELRLREEIEQRKRRIEEIKTEYKYLNEAEVNVVLDYVRSYSNAHKLKETDIDIYLCHCQNKLNGNINDVFLTFKDPAEEKQ
jgi:hypothetical protein